MVCEKLCFQNVYCPHENEKPVFSKLCFGVRLTEQLLARVVQKVDNAVHRINHYPVDSVVCVVKVYPLIMIYPVDSVIQPLNNWGQVFRIRNINMERDENSRESSEDLERLCKPNLQLRL